MVSKIFKGLVIVFVLFGLFVFLHYYKYRFMLLVGTGTKDELIYKKLRGILIN